jgi:hypothetical protein
MPTLDISQFNALLHSEKKHSGLISALRELMSADLGVFIGPVSMFWSFW